MRKYSVPHKIEIDLTPYLELVIDNFMDVFLLKLGTECWAQEASGEITTEHAEAIRTFLRSIPTVDDLARPEDTNG